MIRAYRRWLLRRRIRQMVKRAGLTMEPWQYEFLYREFGA